MNRFDYLSPRNLAEALQMLSVRPEAIPLAGGTDILVQMKERSRHIEALLSLKRVPELHQYSLNGTLTLGSALTVGQIAAKQEIQRDYTALAIGSGLIGSVQIRNMATLGGNLCNAAPSADTAPPLLVLGAEVVIASHQGERVVPLETFFLEPGRTILQPTELVKEIVLSKSHTRTGSFYIRHTPRAGMDIAVVGVAAAITLNTNEIILNARLALGAAAPVPMRAVQAEALLPGHRLTDELLREVGKTASQEAEPIDDLRASAEYRRHLVNILTQRALRGAMAKAKSNQGYQE
ncbi:MAG: xanthine dehydrogenase family protein subunit M [Anaerolineaceae bacterium]|nr:MAG: xanthine dehydrogenase family protein subunit M [Anaerolineaceae bacterium]